MNRILKLPLFALLLFAAGAIAGRLILIDRDGPGTLVETRFSGTPSVTVLSTGSLPDESTPHWPEPVSLDETQHAAFEDATTISFASSTKTLDPSGSAADEAAIRATITQRYPELGRNELDGWVDAYRDLSLRELEELLNAKQLMTDIMPVRSFLQSTAEPATFSPDLTVDSDPLQNAVASVKQNLLHATTAGFRRTIIQTSLPVVSESEVGGVIVTTSHDFSPGEIQPSAGSFHLAIDDDGSHWFRLESNDLLTRHGIFIRLDDGQLGIVSGDSTVYLAADLQVPELATDLRVADDGAVSCQLKDGTRTLVGTLQLARVVDMTKLSSKNGVFFTVSDASAMTMSGDVSVRTGALESSNVDRQKELLLLQHFETLQAFE